MSSLVTKIPYIKLLKKAKNLNNKIYKNKNKKTKTGFSSLIFFLKKKHCFYKFQLFFNKKFVNLMLFLYFCWS
jgi:hypothetical protein